jgi:hypothetical protein
MGNYDGEQKTSRIAMLCVTMGFLGLLFFCSKMNACQSCGKEDLVTCKDEFFEIRNDGYASNHTCTPGARVEVVSSPPAPKAGILCHCPPVDKAEDRPPVPTR